MSSEYSRYESARNMGLSAWFILLSITMPFICGCVKDTKPHRFLNWTFEEEKLLAETTQTIISARAPTRGENARHRLTECLAKEIAEEYGGAEFVRMRKERELDRVPFGVAALMSEIIKDAPTSPKAKDAVDTFTSLINEPCKRLLENRKQYGLSFNEFERNEIWFAEESKLRGDFSQLTNDPFFSALQKMLKKCGVPQSLPSKKDILWLARKNKQGQQQYSVSRLCKAINALK